MEHVEQNNFEGLPRTPDGALFDLPPGTLCADGCGELVEKEKGYSRINADGVERFFIEGHEKNVKVDQRKDTLH